MVFVMPVDSQTARANQTAVLAVRINAYEGWVLAVGVTVVWLYEIFEAFRKLLDVALYRHQ